MAERVIYPFPWSREFGSRMRRLREQLEPQLERLPMQAVHDAGGPSASAQGRIENGPGEGPPLMITADTMRKYALAYTVLSPPSARGEPSQRFDVEESFIMALGAAGAASADLDGMQERQGAISQAAKDTNLNSMVIGISVHDDSVIKTGRLERFPGWKHRHIASVTAEADTELFGRDMVTIASRHPTVSISSPDVTLGGAGPLHLAWPDRDAVIMRADGRLDPIAKIQSLEEARRRATALKVDHDSIEAVASMLFLIAVLTAQFNAEKPDSQEPIGTLEVWRRYENSKRWDALRAMLPEAVAGAMPRTDAMVAATSAALRPWVTARARPPFEVKYQIGPGETIEWFPTELQPEPELSAAAGDLWLVDKEVLPAAEGFIADINKFALIITDTAVGTTDMIAGEPPHYWCPSGIQDNIALIYHPRAGWRAVQTF